MKALTDEESDAMEMKFPVYVHGMLKTESLLRRHPARQGDARSITINVPAERRPEQTPAGSPLLAHPGRRDGGRPAVPGRLSLRLHRADAQPLPADGHHAEGAAEHGPQPQGHPGEAHQPQRPGDRRRRRSAPRTGPLRRLHEPRHRQGQPGLRRGRAARHGQGRRRAADQHAVLRRRLGLVQRLGRAFLAAHHRVRRPRPADRPRQRRGPAAGRARARRGVAEELPGRADPAHPQAPRRRRRAAGRSTPTTSTPSSTWSWSTTARSRQRRDARASSTATATTWPSTPRPCSAWRCTSWATPRSAT